MTGVQPCALPILGKPHFAAHQIKLRWAQFDFSSSGGGQNVRHLPEKSKAKCAFDFAHADTVNFKIAFCNLEIRTKTFRSGLRQNAAGHRAASTSPPKLQSDLHFAILIVSSGAFCTLRCIHKIRSAKCTSDSIQQF